MFSLNNFLWFKEMICLIQTKYLWIKLIFLQNKEINALIYGQRYNMFDSRQKFIWFEPIFIWSKDILFESKNFVLLKQNISLHKRKCFIQIIFLIQSNIFSECSTFDGNPPPSRAWDGAVWIDEEGKFFNLNLSLNRWRHLATSKMKYNTW